ncbi:MAG: ABC transporter ATP-binding protein, partial [Deltaproteobacteria bacterium]|nr:ABC transporter ATP-binding protein [Deltaproteobacteria bacterium]
MRDVDGLPAIEVRDLVKKFKFYQRPSDRLKELFTFGRRTYHQPFYALNGLSFQVYPGETLGVIGENGAGKSTLLKVLAGTVSPTAGSVQIKGKVATLLDLGL